MKRICNVLNELTVEEIYSEVVQDRMAELDRLYGSQEDQLGVLVGERQERDLLHAAAKGKGYWWMDKRPHQAMGKDGERIAHQRAAESR